MFCCDSATTTTTSTSHAGVRPYGENLASTLRLQRVAQQQQQNQQLLQSAGVPAANNRDRSAGRQQQGTSQRRPAAIRATLIPLQPLGQRHVSKTADLVRSVAGNPRGSAAPAVPLSGAASRQGPMRTSSLQNICRAPFSIAGPQPQNQHHQKVSGSRNVASSSTAGKTSRALLMDGVKRSASTQNVSFESSSPPRQRSDGGSGVDESRRHVISSTSASSGSTLSSRGPINAAAVACNAELLANFEREKRQLEARIADLTRRLEEETVERERMAAASSTSAATATRSDNEVPFIDDENADQLDFLRAENRALRERLSAIEVEQQQVSAETERFTDAEKLRLLRWRPTASIGGSTVELVAVGSGGVSVDQASAVAAGRHQSRSFGDLRMANDSSTSSPSSATSNVIGTPGSTGGQAATNHSLNRVSSLSVDAGLDHGGGAAVVAARRDRLALLQVRTIMCSCCMIWSNSRNYRPACFFVLLFHLTYFSFDYFNKPQA